MIRQLKATAVRGAGPKRPSSEAIRVDRTTTMTPAGRNASAVASADRRTGSAGTGAMRCRAERLWFGSGIARVPADPVRRSALATALAFLPAGVMVVVLSTRMASLLGRFGPAPLTAVAFSCLIIAYAASCGPASGRTTRR